MPRASAATLIRPRSSVSANWRKPSPSRPMRFVAGTRTPSKYSGAVGEPGPPAAGGGARPAARLREAEGAEDLTGGQAREVPLPLRLAAVPVEHRGGEADVGVERAAHGARGPRDLLEQQRH